MKQIDLNKHGMSYITLITFICSLLIFLPQRIPMQADLAMISLSLLLSLRFGFSKKTFLIILIFVIFFCIRRIVQLNYPENMYIMESMIRDFRLPLLFLGISHVIIKLKLQEAGKKILDIFIIYSLFFWIVWIYDTSIYQNTLQYYWGERKIISVITGSNRFSGVFALPMTAGIFFTFSSLYYYIKSKQEKRYVLFFFLSMVMGWQTDSAVFVYGFPFIFFVTLIRNVTNKQFLLTLFLLSPFLFIYIILMFNPIFAGRFTENSNVLFFLTNHLNLNYILFGIYDIPSNIKFLFDFGFLNRVATGGIFYFILYYFVFWLIINKSIMNKKLSTMIFIYFIICELGGSSISQPIHTFLLIFILPLIGLLNLEEKKSSYSRT